MSYDTVDFISDIEKRFDISFPDEDSERLCTIGDICDYLSSRARLFLGSPCASATAFRLMRKTLVRETHLQRSQIRPTTQIVSVLTQSELRNAWKNIGKEFNTQLPKLQWSSSSRLIYAACCVIALLLSVGVAVLIPALCIALPVALVSSSLLILSGLWIGNVRDREIPNQITTIGDLSRFLVDRCDMPVNLPPEEIDEWIWTEVVDVLKSNLNLGRLTLQRETHFIRDLFVED